MGSRETNTLQTVVLIVTAVGRCYALLSYTGLIDPDFSVYTRARMVSSKLGRKRKQAFVSVSGRQTHFP